MEPKKGITITIAGLVGLATLVAMGFATHEYFQTDAEASVSQQINDTKHLSMAVDNERGRLENELKLVNLEIDFLLHKQEQAKTLEVELDVEDQDRLGYLRIVRTNLEERLRDLAAAKPTG